MAKKLKLEGLDCASCAYEIEEALKKEGFEFALVNFATKEAVIEGNVEKAKEIIRKVEPDVEVIEEDEHGHSHHGHHHEHGEEDPKKALYFIIPSLMLFGIGVVLRYYYGMDNAFVFGVFVASYLLVGWKVLRSAIINSLHGNVFDENFLIAVATLGAFAIREYPEGVAVMLFYVVGEFFQDLAVDRSRRSIKALLALKAEHANLLRNGEVVRVKPEELKVGDTILVKPGEKVPVDGVVIEGESTVDTSALTGESVPRTVREGEEILSGMVNLSGVLKVRVTKELNESTISRILELVENASARKARTEKFITRFARYYTPAVVGIAALIATVPPLITGDPFSTWVYRALILLVISCPCALVLSIPLGYFGGIGKAAREGILVKGSNYLDALKDASIVAFDKTGTLTKDVFKVTKVETRNGFSEEEIIRFAALAEAHSNHPIAKAIREAYGKEINEAEIVEYEEIAGHGVRARIDGIEVLVGNDRLLHRFNIEHDTCRVRGTVAHVVIDGKYAGYIIISDEIKDDAPKAVKELKRLGVKKVVMVTGDSREVAEEIAKQLGLDSFYAELLPEEKVRVIEELEKEKGDGKVVFVGDGINDAPVLARADVGVAMGALGSDAAIETADIVIMDDKPSKLPRGIRIARKTQRIVWQNIVFALGVKLAFIGLGILGEATMWEAVFADVGVALIAVFNAMRILR
ncbi:cadmium-translocating P-type ATPase [Thermococcus cleftensis]|uniref:Cadmium-translocating P-type ATPase n=1 Tax=Thermococcus cleftensis (strain DSM 27260 / KACC 17922 / CL1) TaxID=163003 RepID=I3ZWG3_THECF|nr:heavy metal translocating P-type ATPase [Thermococcus cleftensis]AFL96047.1 cadmium-translocating P-type ATPase [Thermococcus cleftensis]